MRDLKIPEQRHPEKAHRPDNAQPKKPDWIRVKAPGGAAYAETRKIMRDNNLVTVCEEAGCPNVGECWSQGHATMMIMGDVCTRACTFCNIATGKPPEALDVFEPGRVAHAVEKLGLNHVVITSVDRDDIEDGGADHFAQTIRAVRHRSPGTTIEILTPISSAAPPTRWRPWSRRARMCSTTIWKPCRGSTPRSGPARAISIPCGCCSG